MPKIITTKRICLNCLSDKTYIDNRGVSQWHKFLDGYLCTRCHSNLENPEKNKRRIRFTFKDKRILLPDNPRTGYCSKCSNNIYDGSCKVTHLHHTKYDVKNPLENTIELCVGCHFKESVLLGQIDVNHFSRMGHLAYKTKRMLELIKK